MAAMPPTSSRRLCRMTSVDSWGCFRRVAAPIPMPKSAPMMATMDRPSRQVHGRALSQWMRDVQSMGARMEFQTRTMAATVPAISNRV